MRVRSDWKYVGQSDCRHGAGHTGNSEGALCILFTDFCGHGQSESYDALESGSDKVGVFAHGMTYTGHPVSAAVALECLKIYEERNNSGECTHCRCPAS